jgi:hypothetical protein
MLVDFGRAYLIFPRKFRESLRHLAPASVVLSLSRWPCLPPASCPTPHQNLLPRPPQPRNRSRTHWVAARPGERFWASSTLRIAMNETESLIEECGWKGGDGGDSGAKKYRHQQRRKQIDMTPTAFSWQAISLKCPGKAR